MASSPMTFGKTLLATLLAFFIAFVLVGAVFFGVLVAIIASGFESKPASVQASSVLKVSLSGGFLEYPSGSLMASLSGDGGEMTIHRFTQVMRAAGEDSRIKGVVLDISGYSGGVAQGEELREVIAGFRAQKKFVFAVSDPSGYDESTYFIATACDTIIAHPGSELEMNGIFAELSFYRPMLERIGVRANVVRAGAYKSAVEPFILDSASKENQEMMGSILQSLFSRVTNAVTRSRKISTERLGTVLNETGMLTASEARQEGLVDMVAYTDQVNDLLKQRAGIDKDAKLETVSLTEYASQVAEDDGVSGATNQIAIVYAVGGISTGKSRYSPSPLFGGEMVGSESFSEAMREARDNNNIKAVVLRIDSPGGDATAAEAMWRDVKLCQEKKPVIVSMGRVAASGGYYIAAPADTIVADSTTITGSIGVFGLSFNTRRLYSEKLGINNQVIKTNPHADVSSGNRDLTEGEHAVMERRIDSVYHRFLTVVSEGRGFSTDSANTIAQGRVWTGEQALGIGLVDLLGGLDRAIEVAVERAKLAKDAYSIRILPTPKSWFESLAERLESSAQTLTATERRTPLSEIQATIEALRARSGIQARMFDWTLR